MAMSRLVQEIHSAIPGRIRCKVRKLYRNAALGSHIETAVLGEDRIFSLSVNLLTGNVLILFDPDSNPRLPVRALEKAVLEYLIREGRPVESAARQEPHETEAGEAGIASRSIPQKRPPRPAHVAQPTGRAWHLLDTSQIINILETDGKRGLTPAVASERLARYGSNSLEDAPVRSGLEILLEQFASLPVALLGVAAGLSVVTGGLADAAVILAVVGINAAIGYVTESEAERTINSLKSLVHPMALVIRDEAVTEIAADLVIPGDLLVLRPGTYVAADARIIETANLTADESALTGESIPVTKTDAVLRQESVVLGDLLNMVFSGTLITGGQGTAVVVATGAGTEIGKIHQLVSQAETPETPIERQLTEMGNHLVVISGVLCGVVFAIGILRGNGVLQMLKTPISLAVAAVPEGLAAVATTTLALGIKSMRQQSVLIRNLEAVCTLGSLQTICFDKTGTVTENRMAVRRLYAGMRRIELTDGHFVGGDTTVDPLEIEELTKLLHVSVLCNETEIIGYNGTYELKGSAT
jgi:P-type Ca2+ transporter type 2C